MALVENLQETNASSDGTQGASDGIARSVSQHGFSFARSVSQVLVGGTGVQRQTSGEEPLLRQNTRAEGRQAIEQRLAEELRETFMQHICLFGSFVVLLLLLILFAIYAYIAAIVACFRFSDTPCDQPLSLYLPAHFAMRFVSARLRNMIRPGSGFSMILQILLSKLPIYTLICYGVYMVTHCKTCQVTNPSLYYPTRILINVQVACVLVEVVGSLAVLVFFHQVVRFVGKLSNRPGCVNAIRALPKIQPNAEELAEEVCPICLDSFPEGAIKTPCEHYFHEECLAVWCKSHIDCPLCRQQLGDPDPLEEP